MPVTGGPWKRKKATLYRILAKGHDKMPPYRYSHIMVAELRYAVIRLSQSRVAITARV